MPFFAGSVEAMSVERNCDPLAKENLDYTELHRKPDGTIKIPPGCPDYDDVDPGYAIFL